ncbi:MAG: site-specific DNA-methyltransferase [Pirellulaceae bacterium]|nr:site-specific DNA-methyltransferase [Pirellulaceae bacterium]
MSHGDDEDMTREPEMVQAYRDTWELGLHSYLTYLRDRLLLCRDLLTPSGSIFVQISDENLHHVREVMDEVFGAENRIGIITVVKTSAQEADELSSVCDYLIWYARDKNSVKYRKLWQQKSPNDAGASDYNKVELPNGERRRMTRDECDDWNLLVQGSRIYTQDNIVSQRPPGDFPVEFEGETYRPITGYWKTGVEGMTKLIAAKRIEKRGRMLRYVRFFGDFPYRPIANFWPDVRFSSRVEDKLYVVQTTAKAIERCLLMATDPGDLVLDPTCGSGTTAYVAEQWGRRWITVDTSRVPLALARQRLLTATFPWYDLKDPGRGPAGGFVYQRRQNKKGEEVGGIVPHITLKSIANNEPPQEEVLVDRPETVSGITRVTGAFCFEASIPPAAGDESGVGFQPAQKTDSNFASHVERMIEILRKSPLLRLDGGKTVLLKNIRPPAKSLSLSAEAQVDPSPLNLNPTLNLNPPPSSAASRPIAIVIGPENGPVSSRLVEHAAREAAGKSYSHLYVIGFAIEAKAREAIEHCETVFDIPATYVQATPDLLMGDLLKNMRSSQIFSVCGLPEVRVFPAGPKGRPYDSPGRSPGSEEKTPSKPRRGAVIDDETKYQVELLGLDVFDPVTMENQSRTGNDVPAWFLDTDYNGLCFHVSQAFFPRTSAWDNLKKALKGQFDETVWDHLAGTISAPFEAGDHRTIAVKVIDDRGNELLVVKELK